jgi:Ring finger domain
LLRNSPRRFSPVPALAFAPTRHPFLRCPFLSSQFSEHMESTDFIITTQSRESDSKSSSAGQTQLSIQSPEICVICLDRISDSATTLPCRHDHFHFACLGTWLQHQQRCPLCKEQVRSVRFKESGEGSKLFNLPQVEAVLPRQSLSSLRHGHDSPRGRFSGLRQRRSPQSLASKRHNKEDPALTRHHHVYAYDLYSLHVGSNRHSRYLPSGSITPDLFSHSNQHLSRAKAFTRRELKVFEFLDPSPPTLASRNNNDAEAQRPLRRATNREFLLEYIVAILQAIPLKGSEGQAEKFFADYLGTGHARLFLHELESWLRSPFERLEQWDAAVQYRDAFVERVGDYDGER